MRPISAHDIDGRLETSAPVTPLAGGAIHVWLAPWPDRRPAVPGAGAESTWTRGVLAGYLGVAPGTLVFERGPFGKPRLAGATAAALEFNLSHSGGLIALAVARQGVGIDVEAVRPLPELEALVACSLAAAERRDWELAPPERRLDVFHRLWTRKEACLKAAGTGLVVNLEDAATIPHVTIPGVRHVQDWRLGAHHVAVASTCAGATVTVRVFDQRTAVVVAEEASADRSSGPVDTRSEPTPAAG